MTVITGLNGARHLNIGILAPKGVKGLAPHEL
jgi:hypothetical protein